MKPLTPKQQRFVAEYLVDLNATQAAIRAGYAAKHADVEGPRLLGNVGIAAAIQAGQAAKLAQINVSAEGVVQELAGVAFSNLQRLFRPTGELIPIHELPPSVAASIASMELVLKNAEAGDGKIDRVLKVRMWDKVRGLELLARRFGLLLDRVELSGDVTLTAKIAAARERGARLLEERNGSAAT
jgi:phage terminase small subunit